MTAGNPYLSALFITNTRAAISQIVQVIDECDGNLKQAARELKVGRSSLYRWIREYPQIRLSVQRIRGETDEELLDDL